MQNKTAEQVYPVHSGLAYLHSEDVLHFYIHATLEDELQAEALQKTAEAMRNRCPYMFAKPERRDGAYVLVTTDDAYPITETDGYVMTNEPRNNGFLFAVSYHANRLYFCFHHGLTDGGGALRFTRSFITEYLRQATGQELHCPEELTPGTPEEEAEYEDPYKNVRHEEDPFTFSQTSGFSFTEADIAPTSRRMLLRVPVESILKLSKNAESNFSSVLAMVLCLSINDFYPVEDEPILIKCPVDTRSLTKSEKNMQNCHCSIYFVYSRKIRNLPLDQQLSCFKGMMLLQTSEEYLMDHLEKKKFKFEKMCASIRANETKQGYFQEKKATPVVSYLKSVELGDAAPYVDMFGIDVPLVGVIGMHMTSYCFKDACYLNLRTNLKSDDCIKAVPENLRRLNIPYEIVAKEGF